MKALAPTPRISLFCHQPLTVRLLAAAAGLLTVAAAFAAPAEADPATDDSFIDALNHAGIDFGEPGNAMAVGQSICPMLAQPGGNFAAAAASVSNRGLSPGMAKMFTTIAIQMYCPQEVASIASGNPTAACRNSRECPGFPEWAGFPEWPGSPEWPGTTSACRAGRWSTRCRSSPPRPRRSS